MNLKKIRNALLVTLSLALVAAASVAITFALGDSKSFGDAENDFNNAEIKASLTEVHWDGEKGKPTDNTEDPTVAEADQGKTKAKSYIPGDVIPKDPKVNNTSEKDINEYVGIKAEYFATIDGTEYQYYTLAQFEAAIAQLCTSSAGAHGIDSNWEKNSEGTHFYCQNIVAQNTGSVPLFTYVKVNTLEGGDTKTYKVKTYANKTQAVESPTYVETDSLPSFEIKLYGYAISADGNASLNDDAKDALDKLMA